MSVTLTMIGATVTCRCGETVEVSLSGADAEALDLQAVDADLETEAEESHGWGSGGSCPACERIHARECAAEAREEREREATA